MIYPTQTILFGLGLDKPMSCGFMPTPTLSSESPHAIGVMVHLASGQPKIASQNEQAHTYF